MQHRCPLRVRTLVRLTYLLAFLVPASTGCKRTSPEIRTETTNRVSTHSAELAPPPAARSVAQWPKGIIKTVAVPNDRDVLVVVGENERRPIVHLHGMCASPRPDLEAWGPSMSARGIVIALEGRAPCPNGTDGSSWEADPIALDARIDAAIRAVGVKYGVELDEAEMVVVGESMGAARATALASHFPSKYTRLVLVGGPNTPTPKDLGGTKAVVFLAGEHEPQEKMRAGAQALESAGRHARFWQLEGARHGDYGPDGARAMNEAVAFVTDER